MDEEIEDLLKSYIAGSEKHDLEWAKERYDEALNEVEESLQFEMDEDAKKRAAARLVRSDVVEANRSGGPSSEVPILALGHGGLREWNDQDTGGRKDILVAYGLLKPPEDPLGKGVFILDSTDGVDLFDAKDKFQSLNTLKADFSVTKSDELADTYICWSTEDTEVTEEDLEDVPSEKGDIRKLLHNFTEEADIANISDYISAFEEYSYEYEGETRSGTRALEWGGDIKRINGEVVDVYRKDDGSTAAYTILDESILDESDLPDEVISEQQRTHGLTCWCDPDHLQYGQGSQCEFYGTINVNDNDGRISMDVFGIVPLLPRPLDESALGGGGSTDDDNVEEDTIN